MSILKAGTVAERQALISYEAEFNNSRKDQIINEWSFYSAFQHIRELKDNEIDQLESQNLYGCEAWDYIQHLEEALLLEADEVEFLQYEIECINRIVIVASQWEVAKKNEVLELITKSYRNFNIIRCATEGNRIKTERDMDEIISHYSMK